MCFAIPGKVISIDGEIAQVDFIGQRKEINMKFVNAKPGDYVITAGKVAADVIPTAKAKALVDAFLKARKEIGDI